MIKEKILQFIEKRLLIAANRYIRLHNIPTLNDDLYNHIKNHVIDLNLDKNSSKIASGDFFHSIKNKLRLAVTLIRLFETKNLINMFVKAERSKCVDFGAGTGVLLHYLGLDGVGVDVSRAAVSQMEAAGLLAYELNDFEEHGDNDFEIGFAFEVIEHVTSPIEVINSISNHLCKDAVFFVSIPYVKHTRVVRKKRSHQMVKRPENYHIHEYSSSDFINILTHTEFEVHARMSINPYRYSILERPIAFVLGLNKPKWSLFVLKRI